MISYSQFSFIWCLVSRIIFSPHSTSPQSKLSVTNLRQAMSIHLMISRGERVSSLTTQQNSASTPTGPSGHPRRLSQLPVATSSAHHLPAPTPSHLHRLPSLYTAIELTFITCAHTHNTPQPTKASPCMPLAVGNGGELWLCRVSLQHTCFLSPA